MLVKTWMFERTNVLRKRKCVKIRQKKKYEWLTKVSDEIKPAIIELIEQRFFASAAKVSLWSYPVRCLKSSAHSYYHCCCIVQNIEKLQFIVLASKLLIHLWNFFILRLLTEVRKVSFRKINFWGRNHFFLNLVNIYIFLLLYNRICFWAIAL